MNPCIYFSYDHHNIHNLLDFHFFKKIGYDVIRFDELNFDFLLKLKNNDILYVDYELYKTIDKIINPNLKIVIFIYRNHEFLPITIRKKIIKDKSVNHQIFFITTHLDDKTHSFDLSLSAKCFSFIDIFWHKINSDIPTFRNKSFNLFNRNVNLRRLKVFELLKKQDIKLNDCYFTFAGTIIQTPFFDLPIFATNPLWRKYKNTHSLREYYELKSRGEYEIDIDFIESHRSDFFSYHDSGYLVKEDMDIIYEQSLDSYISFITESVDDAGIDLRITEKTIRAFLCKNIFLPLASNEFSKSLRKYNLKTFEDVFGLEFGWDENKSEIERIHTFVDKISYINNLSMEDIKKIYNRSDIQERLNHNYNFIMNALKSETLYSEIKSKIHILNNKSFL
jgi:hypothetical protein